MSIKFRILLSSACAVLAVLLCVVYGSNVREAAEQERSAAMERYGGETVRLVVATQSLEPGDVINRQNVEVRDWLSALAPEGAITNLDDALNKSVTVAAPKGAPLTQLAFRDTNAALEVPSGHVAIAVPLTDKLGVAPSITPGSKVVAYEAGETAAALLGSDVTILSSPGSASSAGRPSITIAVLPEDVSKILAANNAGNLRLVVPANDVSEVGSADQAAPQTVDKKSN